LVFPIEQTPSDNPVITIRINPTRKLEYALWMPTIFSENATKRKINIFAISERIIEKNKFRIEFLKSITRILIIACPGTVITSRTRKV
jgi:hypothetical protein